MRDQSFASPDDIDLTALWAKLRRAAPRLIAVSAAAGIVTYIVLSMMAPRFVSQAELAIVDRATNPFSNPNNPASGYDTLPSRWDKEAVSTHIRALLSSNLAAKVAGELGLKSYREFNPSLGPVDSLGAVLDVIGLGGSRPGISEDDVVLNEFFSRLDVHSPAESRVINIRFSSVEPDLAAKITNTLAETYRQELANATVAETDTLQTLLAHQIEELSKEVSKAEAEVASFRAKSGGDSDELRRLEAKAAAKRGELERLAAQYEASRAPNGGGIAPMKAQIITRARPSSVPVFPRKIPYTVLVVVGTLLLGTAVVITAGLAAGARRASDDERLLREDIAIVAASSPPPLEPDPTPSQPSPGTRANPQLPHAPHPLPVFRSPVALAAHLMSSAASVQTGLRTMLASEADPATTAAVAWETAIAMTESGVHTLLIDGGFDAGGLAAELKSPRAPGLAELLSGTARFSDVVRCLPGSDVHIIGSGRASAKGEAELDADQLNMILDALDEAYDQIIVVAPVEPARILFETIQGRFDMGIIIEQASIAPALPRANPGTYLGFVVNDIGLLRFEVEPAAGKSSGEAATRKAAARGSIHVA